MLDWLARLLTKAAGSASAVVVRFGPPWVKEAHWDFSWRNLVSEGYRKNSAVFACVRTLALAFPEPRCVVTRRTPGGGGGRELLDEHPLTLLLDRPNPQMGQAEFWAQVITWLAIGGNCYLIKVRNGKGEVVELWPLHDGLIRPQLHATEWVSGYLLDDGSLHGVPVPKDDVVHLRWAPDPFTPQMGISPIVAIAREIDADNEAARYVYALLKNDATPRTIITSKEALSDRSFERLKEQFKQRYGGSARGDVMVAEGDGVTVQRIGLNLNELADNALRTIPETRIAAAFEVPALLAGLNAGLERATFSNAQALREFYTETTLIPRWRLVADALQRGLLPEFGNPADLSVDFDTAEVRALADDEDNKAKRVALLYQAGVLKLDEARTALGYDALPDGAGDAVRNTTPAPALPPAEPAEPAGNGTPVDAGPAAFLLEGGAGGKSHVPVQGRITDEQYAAALALWDRTLPEYAGLLTATTAPAKADGDG